jgi:hypothetical protein
MVALALSFAAGGQIEPELVASLLRNPAFETERWSVGFQLHNIGEDELAFRVLPPRTGPVNAPNMVYAHFREKHDVDMMAKHAIVVPNVDSGPVFDLLCSGSDVDLQRAIDYVRRADAEGTALGLALPQWRDSSLLPVRTPQTVDLCLFLARNHRPELMLRVYESARADIDAAPDWVFFELMRSVFDPKQAEALSRGNEVKLSTAGLVFEYGVNGKRSFFEPMVRSILAGGQLEATDLRFGGTGSTVLWVVNDLVNAGRSKEAAEVMARSAGLARAVLTTHASRHDDWERALYKYKMLDTIRSCAVELLAKGRKLIAGGHSGYAELISSASLYSLLGEWRIVEETLAQSVSGPYTVPSVDYFRARKLQYDGEYERSMAAFIALPNPLYCVGFYGAAYDALNRMKPKQTPPLLRRVVARIIERKDFEQFHGVIYRLANRGMKDEIRRLISVFPVPGSAETAEACAFAVSVGDTERALALAYPLGRTIDGWLQDLVMYWRPEWHGPFSVLADVGGRDLLTPGLEAFAKSVQKSPTVAGFYTRALALCDDEARSRAIVARAIVKCLDGLDAEARNTAELAMLKACIPQSAGMGPSRETQWFLLRVLRDRPPHSQVR